MARNKYTVIGFAHDEDARVFARKIHAPFVSAMQKKYPAGELYIELQKPVQGNSILVSNVTESSTSVWTVCLAANAIHHSSGKKPLLVAPYIAYGRQDRPTGNKDSAGGEALAKLLHQSFRQVYTLDLHSLIFQEAFIGHITNIWPTELVIDIAQKKGTTAIAAPDHGAHERAHRVAKRMRLPYISCKKKRMGPGKVRLMSCKGHVEGKHILLVDDMIDTGGTMRAAATQLKKQGAASVHACVTHRANLHGRISARAFDLDSIEILYQRNKPISKELLELLVKAV